MNNNDEEENQNATTSKKLKRKEDEEDVHRSCSYSASTASYYSGRSQGKDRRCDVKTMGLRGERKERKVERRKRVRRGRVGKPRRSAARRRRAAPVRRAARRPQFLMAKQQAERSDSSICSYHSSITLDRSESGGRSCPRCGHKCCRLRSGLPVLP